MAVPSVSLGAMRTRLPYARQRCVFGGYVGLAGFFLVNSTSSISFLLPVPSLSRPTNIDLLTPFLDNNPEHTGIQPPSPRIHRASSGP